MTVCCHNFNTSDNQRKENLIRKGHSPYNFKSPHSLSPVSEGPARLLLRGGVIVELEPGGPRRVGLVLVEGGGGDGGGEGGGGVDGDDGDGVRGADDGGGRDHLAVGRVRVVVVGVQGQARGAARGENKKKK